MLPPRVNYGTPWIVVAATLPSPHPTYFSIIPKKTNPYDQHLTNNHRKNKKIIKYFTTNQNIVQSFFFFANIFSTYFSPSTFSPKKFSHFFHNPQDSLAARLTHSLTSLTTQIPKKTKNAKNAAITTTTREVEKLTNFSPSTFSNYFFSGCHISSIFLINALH